MEIQNKDILLSLAEKNVSDIVHLAIEHDGNKNMLVIYDLETGLSNILFESYKNSFPNGNFVNFNDTGKEKVLETLASLEEKDLVVLIQSTDFRLSEFRIRLHLFERGIKVIDHMHLSRNNEETWQTYINSLAYDPKWYRGVGHELKDKLSDTSKLVIKSGEHKLIVTGGLEDPKPNLGDYRNMKNIGGTFPIGEVFTEAKDLALVNGSLMIYAFADVNFNVSMHNPFRIDIKDGLVVGWSENTPESFTDVIAKIKTNERAIVREIGFGLNKAITRENYLNDITAFERILGIHVSLGEKHTVYKKEGITSKKTRFHVDLFLDVYSVTADGEEIFKNGEYIFK
jgi:aminopeptidase